MTSYRFCRPDDVQLLIKAFNTCVLPHFPEYSSLDFDSYKQLVNEQQLWASSCMVALDKDKDDVVAVCMGCKREEQTLIMFAGCRPDNLRQGHVSHMLNSLKQKLSILGPPQILVEVPETNQVLAGILKELEFELTHTMSDYELLYKEQSLPQFTPEQLSIADLLASGLYNKEQIRAWGRQVDTLEKLEGLKCLAVVSAERIEAYLICVGSEVFGLGCFDSELARTALRSLVVYLASVQGDSLLISKLVSSEFAGIDLELMGFEAGEVYHRYWLNLADGDHRKNLL